MTYEGNERLFNGVIDRLREPHHVKFAGEDDWVNAYVVINEHPPFEVMVGTSYTVDDRPVCHDTNQHGQDPIVLQEGESVRMRVELKEYTLSTGGPGADTMTLHFNRVE